MSDPPDFKTMPGTSKEIRDELVATFDALSNWRDEIETVNERCLNKVLNRTSAVAHSMGWPDPAIRTMRECLENASKAQTQMIEQIIEGWKRQLKSAAPMTMSGGLASAFPNANPGFNPLAPWMLWLQAVEMWQRTWIPDALSQKNNRPH
jgi:hypothetical protein